MTKPIVHYSELHYCKVGLFALVEPVDHPSPVVSNSRVVRTSAVKSYDKSTGEFETRNTKYKPIWGMAAPAM